MPRFLFFADLHCHEYSQFSRLLPNGRNSRFNDCLSIVHQAKEICLREHVDVAFFLGDCFHSRTKLSVDVHTSTYLAFKSLSEVTKVVMLKGNHDEASKVGEVHSLEAFKAFAEVVEEPKIAVYNDKVVALYPHTAYPQGMIEWMKQMPAVDLFLFHQGISEAAVGPYDMHVQTEVSIKDLPLDRCHLAIAGDFHKRQQIKNFHYVGSPLQLSFLERDEDKGFSLVFWDDVTNGAYIEFIESEAPKFHIVQTDQDLTQFRQGDFVRVICKDANEAQIVKNAHPTFQTEVQAKEEEALIRIDPKTASNDQDLLKEYIRQKHPDLDHDRLLEMGISYLLSVGVED